MTENTTEDPRPAVRVPNVRPNAVSGLAHTPLRADNGPSVSSDTEGVIVPAGDLDTRLTWVRQGETQEERAARGDAVWQHEVTTQPDDDHDDLADALRDAVYSVPGQESETGGEGDAVNADTGEVTQPGDPLPPIDQDSGDPLLPDGVDTAQDPAAVQRVALDAGLADESIPDTVDGLNAWIDSAEDSDEAHARALAVLGREQEQDNPRVTLVDPLTAATAPPQ